MNPKLSGRLQLCPPDEKKAGPVHVVLHFGDPPTELRYVDAKTMGQVYLTERLQDVPTFEAMGPDALAISPEEFRLRLRTFHGEIKGILVRAPFIAGIGNAYADEILWQAQLHPFRKRTSLTAEEIDRLYAAIGGTLREATTRVRQEMGEAIHLKPRDFFAVHMRPAILDLQGRVEVATESTKKVFGLKPGIQVQSLPLKWLADLYDQVLQHTRPLEPERHGTAIQRFDRGQERFFRPVVVPILDAVKQPTGVVMTLKDVTEQRHQDDLKRGVISTVSHQLKTPLTSMRMAIHLLLEEKVGPLNEKQAELLVAAREDSDRLHDILNNLLDISRIESGRVQM